MELQKKGIQPPHPQQHPPYPPQHPPHPQQYYQQQRPPNPSQYNKPPPHIFSPEYAKYIGSKPRAQASARIGLGGVK